MSSSNCYSSLYPFPIDLNEDVYNDQQQFHELEEEKVYVSQDRPLKSDCELKLSVWKEEGEERGVSVTHQSHENITSAKWMPSKMRILRKMMNSDHVDLSNNYKLESEDQHKQQQQQQPSSSPDHSGNSSYNNNNNSTIRVCADCNTTKTPLWRSGPRGPKSLCNACGIRQRKARRAMAAAAATGTAVFAETTTTASMKSKVQHKAKRSSDGRVPHFKNKRCKLNPQSQSRKKLCFEDLRIILSKNSAFHRVFPQDEKEAAILLMALSYGLVHG
ncbi:cytokinin-responsive gata factor 1, GATA TRANSCRIPTION FACTOR 22, GNC-LIKE [Hibiscus trionum]|uniref:Cytokinin-responsive gata factor 1, GATA TRANSCRIPTION FACTOR 22, GNC-LIKE n=1 Tax=Hibiscus trionum TaxID=183268 RepID=A0A9W7IDY7_HIBTR|nr:cytokinin-responsive gata factor 1, GATA TRANSCRIPTION FACTOR 22, GNC-LIKE [Hibiscus trionum]